MEINLQTISDLRAQTGAGIADCKKALEEANGDIAIAIENLRKKGELKAAKKTDRATKEGLVALAQEDNKVAAVVLACETDFVSRNQDFIQVTENFAQTLLQAEDLEQFKAQAEDRIKSELIVKIGENIQLADYGVLTGETVGSYLHSNKKTAAVVVLSGGQVELANDLAMQVTAMSPQYVRPEDIPDEEIAKEKEIYREQLKAEGKPEQIWDKIIEGKLNKFYQDVCLEHQEYIKDDSKRVKDLLGEVRIVDFKKYSV